MLRGPQLGAASPDATTADAPSSLTGTYIPLYPLNNFFGRIPVLGLALGAGARGGLIGVTFKIEGDRRTARADQSAFGGGARHLPEDLRLPVGAPLTRA